MVLPPSLGGDYAEGPITRPTPIECPRTLSELSDRGNENFVEVSSTDIAEAG
jgi:hypothetical protein